MKAIKKKNILIITLYLFFSISLSAQNSYIQVTSKAGISVFLDGVFKGETSTDIGGLIIKNVKAGNHTIIIAKAGFSQQEDNISIKSGEVYLYKVKPLAPEIKISQKGNEKDNSITLYTGSLKIQSVPISITISIPKLEINNKKIEDEWLAEDIPEGKYLIIFNWNGKKLNDNIEIKRHQLLYLFVDMLELKINNHDYSTSKAIYSNQGNNIVVTALKMTPNGMYTETNKAQKTDAISISFKLDKAGGQMLTLSLENGKLLKKVTKGYLKNLGDIETYVVVHKPSGEVLNVKGSFKLKDGIALEYSYKTIVNYKNYDLDVDMLIKSEEYGAGIYPIKVYIEGQLVIETKLELFNSFLGL